MSSFTQHEVKFDASHGLYHENYVVLRSFGGAAKMVQCGCQAIFFTDYHSTKIECPTCKAENAILDAIEKLAEFALVNNLVKELEPVLMSLTPTLSSFDLDSEDEFPNLSKYLGSL